MEPRFSFSYDGIPFPELNCTVRQEGDDTVYTLPDGLELTCHVQREDDYGIVRWVNSWHNPTDHDSGRITDLYDCDITVPFDPDPPRTRRNRQSTWEPDMLRLWITEGANVSDTDHRLIPHRLWAGDSYHAHCEAGRSGYGTAPFFDVERRGHGILLGGVPGVERGKVVIIGGGIAGTYAAKAAVGMGAEVTVIDNNLNRLVYLDDIFGASITTLYSTETNIARAVSQADLVIGTVLIPGATAPKLIRREHLSMMKRGAVIVDVAIDQGGCCETSHVTFHDDPVFVEQGVVHYCVGNMPGAVPRTSTIALTNATLRYGLAIANHGLEDACRRDPGLAMGVNTHQGRCTNQNVAESLGVTYSKMF